MGIAEMSVLGRNVHRYTIQASAPAGVRARREFIAELLDQRLSHNSHSRVLAVASGHLREASMSSAVRRRRFSEFVALDADHKSLQQVQKDTVDSVSRRNRRYSKNASRSPGCRPVRSGVIPPDSTIT